MQELNELQQWLLDNGRPFLADSAARQRARLSQTQQALLEQQIAWRHRGRFRFPVADRWLWTDRSLSQSSDWLSAIFKAAMFPIGELVVDGCCGAGVDSAALALRGPVLAVDSDSWLAALAASNAAAHGQQIRSLGQPLSLDTLSGARWIHVDPDRRPDEVKALDDEQFSPPLSDLISLSRHVEGGLFKVAPSTIFSEANQPWIDESCWRLWLGSYGECRQQLLAFGALRNSPFLGRWIKPTEQLQPELRAAVVISAANGLPMSLDDPATQFEDPGSGLRCDLFAATPSEPADSNLADEVDQYVFDLHACLHASELNDHFATAHRLSAINDFRGYFTGDQPIHSGLVQCFEVVEVLPWDDRKLRKWLRSNRIGKVEVKCRLAKVDANSCQRRYCADSGESITLLVTRMGERVRAIACRRCEPAQA